MLPDQRRLLLLCSASLCLCFLGATSAAADEKQQTSDLVAVKHDLVPAAQEEWELFEHKPPPPPPKRKHKKKKWDKGEKGMG